MAGLLDIFGSGGSQQLGLLGMSADDIQRARDDAQAQALYALAGRLFQGGKTGQSIAQGLQMGQQAYQQAMKGQLADRFQTAQIQEMVRQKQEQEAAKARQAQVQKLIASAVQPAVTTETPLMDITGQQVMGPNLPQPVRFDLQAVTPQLMAIPEGQTALANLAKLQEVLQPKLQTLKPEEQLGYMQNGRFVTVAQGAPKAPEVPKLTGIEANAALLLYGTSDINKIRDIPNAVDRIRQEAAKQREASKPQINLSDPTAVAARQLQTINQWEGVLKDAGDTVTASRANAFYNAYDLAKKGNVNADGALIYNIAKVYDSTGAVQQGDVDTIIGNRSIPTKIQLFAQKLKAGGTFTPKERENMKEIIDGMVEERKKAIEPSLNTYRKMNKQLGGEDTSIYNPYDMIKKPKSLEDILGFGQPTPGRPRGGM